MDERRRLAKQGQALSDGSYPIPDKAHLSAAIQAYGRCPPANRAALVNLIRKRARELGAMTEKVAQFLKDHAGGTTKTA